MANNIKNDKQKALLARKEKLLQEIKYYEKRIADFHASKPTSSYFEDNYSSDSDTELPVPSGPSATQLRLQQSQLQTSLQALRELTNLLVLQSEANVVEEPAIVDEPQVSKPGVWREVIAECRLDLIPFTISFHVHTPSEKFGALSYRNLTVSPVKAAHEAELSRSILAHSTTPSEAVEVVRQYSSAQRSRRGSLAALVDKYNNLLFMQPVKMLQWSLLRRFFSTCALEAMPEGGYIIKCARLFELRWILRNKSSPLEPFHHQMKFELEYMDEPYVKAITQYHRQLSDPSLDTDGRTALLCKIINTCLEAKGPIQELYESLESDDNEIEQFRMRQKSLGEEITETEPKKKRDDDIMAPPKSLPKKSKAKGKENVDSAKKDDRDSYVSGNSVKSDVFDRNVNRDSLKSKNGKKDKDNGREEVSNKVDGRKESVPKSSKDNEGRKDAKSTKEGENGDARKKIVDNNGNGNENAAKSKADNRKDAVAKADEGTASDGTKTSKSNDKVIKSNEKDGNKKKDNVRNTNIVETVHSKDTKNTEKNNIEDGKKISAKVVKKRVVSKVDAEKKVERSDKNDKECATKEKNNKNVQENNLNDNKSVAKKNKKTDDAANIPAKKSKIDNTAIKTQESNVKAIERTKKSVNNVNKPQNIVKNVPKNDKAKTTQKIDAKNQKNIPKTNTTFTKTSETLQKVTEKNKMAATKGNLADRTYNADRNDVKKAKITTNNIQNKIKNVKSNIENNKNVNNERFSSKMKVITGNTKGVRTLSAGNTAKNTSTDSKVSKIPQKLMNVKNSLQKNPLRISPRKMTTMAKKQAIGSTMMKPVTNIPRLLKKPAVK